MVTDQDTRKSASSPNSHDAGRAPAIQLAARAARPQMPWLVLMLLVAGMVLLPIVPLLWEAWKNDADGLRRMAGLHDIGGVFLNTIALGFGAAALAMFFGTVLALCAYSMTPRTRKWMEFLPIVPMLIPSVAHVVGFVFLFSPENGYANTVIRALTFSNADSGPINVYTFEWIIIYTAIQLASFVYLFVYTGLQNLGSEYSLAARVNGASATRALFTTTLPLLRPTLVYAGVVVLLLALGQFTGPLILGRREQIDVLTTRMFVLTTEYPVDYPLASALGTPLILMAVVLVFIQARAVRNQGRFVGQGSSSIDNRTLSPAVSLLSAGVVAVYTAISAILPLLAVAFVSVSPYWTGSISFENLTMLNLRTVLTDSTVIESAITTVVVSLIGVLLALPLGFAIALAINNRDRLWRPVTSILDFAANLPLTVPAALLGFGFLFAFSQLMPGLYGTQIALAFAFVIIMIPYSVRYQLATLVSMGRQTTEASQVAGASPLRTFFTVTLPLARTGITSAATVMFILLSHEFGVALLLRSSDAKVLSVALYEEYTGGSYTRVAVIALLMTVVTGVGVIAATLTGGRKALQQM